MKRFFALLVFVCLLCSCSQQFYNSKKHHNSIVILYENDVHCGIDGYKKFAGLRNAIQQADTAWVAAVSCGDFLQGGYQGSLSHGQYIIDILKNVQYDVMTLGNHEFDFGTPRMMELLKQLDTPVVCANFFEAGSSKPFYDPFVILKFGKKRIAFVGVCTPETMQAESYSIFDKDGKQLYDLKKDEVAFLVQKAVDKARKKADYVVLLSHLGEKDNGGWITSHMLVERTRGIDCVLDGHSHAVVPLTFVNNLDGKPVPISQTGTQFNNVGKLLISDKGVFSTELIPTKDIPHESRQVSATIDSVNLVLAPMANRVVAKTNFPLVIQGDDGKRIIRSAETNLGDLVADAFRNTMDADLGLTNGGGIRKTIQAGDIKYADVMNTVPFANYTCKIEATGQDIVNMLEKCTALTPNEDGCFPHMAGIRFTIHTVSHKVSDVEVFDRATATYRPIELSHTYTIGTNSYYADGGYYDVLKECKLLKMTSELMADTFTNFIEKTLGGTVNAVYEHPQGRITIVND